MLERIVIKNKNNKNKEVSSIMRSIWSENITGGIEMKEIEKEASWEEVKGYYTREKAQKCYSDIGLCKEWIKNNEIKLFAYLNGSGICDLPKFLKTGKYVEDKMGENRIPHLDHHFLFKSINPEKIFLVSHQYDFLEIAEIIKWGQKNDFSVKPSKDSWYHKDAIRLVITANN